MKNSLWAWIGDIKRQHPDPSHDDFIEALNILSRKERVNICKEYQSVFKKLDRSLVWAAGSIINGRILGDDSYEYFRGWIIWSGKDVYDIAICNPDDFSSLDIGLSPPFLESIGILSEDASDIPLVLAPEDFSRTWSWRDWDENMFKKHFPKLCNKFGCDTLCVSNVADKGNLIFLDSPGLGVVRVGDRLKRKNGGGVGVVMEIIFPETWLTKVRFSSGDEVVTLTSDYFDWEL